jgi:hypothetical protein
MDTNQLIKHSRARFDHAAAKRTLKEKYQGKLTFAYNGGLWLAGPDLITTLMACLNSTAIILDLYDNPVEVEVNKLLNQAQEHWQSQMALWLTEYNELNRKR